MKKVNFIPLRSKLPLLSLVFLLTFSTTIYAQEDPAETGTVTEATEPQADAPADAGGDVAAGEALFKANCAACHKLDGKAVGPALRNVADKYDRDWLYKWIHNSTALIASGDALAVKLFEENNKAVMPPFPALSEADIDNILAYTNQPKVTATPPPGGDIAGATTSTDSGVSNTLVLGALALIFLLLVIMLFLVTNTLKRIAEANG